MAKISGFIIGLILVSGIMGLLGLVVTNISVTYNVDYDQTDIDSYTKIQELNNLTQDIQDEADKIKSKSGLLDILGDFFSQGYKALKLSYKSVDVFTSMTDASIDKLHMGAGGSILKTMLVTITLIALIIAVLLAAIVKWVL